MFGDPPRARLFTPRSCVSLVNMASTSGLNAPRPVAIDLFSGAGGLSLGFEMAGFDVVSAVEYDPVHAATHLYNFPLTDILCRDVARIDRSDLLKSAAKGWAKHNPDAGKWDGTVDVIIGGPSCQGFSAMGKRDVDDERNKLIGEFVRLVEQVKPKAFVMENVPGILSAQYEALLGDALARFRAAGYVLADHSRPLDAADYGVPQRRKRVVFIGVLGAIDAPVPPAPTHDEPVTVADAFAGLPSLVGREGYEGDLFELNDEQLRIYTETTNAYLCSLREYDRKNFAHPRPVNPRVLTGSRVTEHKAASIARFAGVEEGRVEPISRAWRLSTGAPSRTLRAGTGRERGAFSASRPLHPKEPRVITVREAARLHSFPDWFRFHTTNWHGHRQIGNAVPPLLARAVGEAVLSALGIDPRHSNQKRIDGGDAKLLELTPTSAAERLSASTDEVPRARRRVSTGVVPRSRTEDSLAG